MKIKTIRIHYEGGETKYELFDRNGVFSKLIDYPIEIFNLKVKRFGFCNIDTVDVTLELEEPIDSSEIKRRKFKIVPQPKIIDDFEKVCEIVGKLNKLGFITHIKIIEE